MEPARHKLADVGDAKGIGQVSNARFGQNPQAAPGAVGAGPRVREQLHADEYRFAREPGTG